MTEAEWVACRNTPEMLTHLARIGTLHANNRLGHDPATTRKGRLLACAYCRRVWHFLLHQRTREAVEVAERYADKQGHLDDLAACRWQPPESAKQYSNTAALAVSEVTGSYINVETVSHRVAYAICYKKAKRGTRGNLSRSPALAEQNALHCASLRCIFGNPFRPITLAPAYRTPTVVSLARAAYDERNLPSGELDPHMLAVLADALEGAGAPGDVVAHLRGPGPHVRGCFVVDLVLGLS